MATDNGYIAVAFASIYTTLCCIGAVLNVVLLIVFTRHPETRTPENILLINLCISDVTYLLTFLTGIEISPSEDFGTQCYVYVITRSFTTALNAYSVAAISVQRYVGLVTYRIRLPTDKTDYVYSFLILAGVWSTVILLVALESIPVSQGKDHFCNNYFVIMGAAVCRLFMYGVIPSAIISVFYVAAACRVNRSALHLPGVECEALQTLREQRKKSARILFALAVVFIVTHTPVLVLIFIYTMAIKLSFAPLSLYCSLTAYLMSTLSPIFNPIALCIASRQLRELYLKYCCCCCCQAPATQSMCVAMHNRSGTVEERHA